VAPLLAEVPHPTLLIWGENDRVLSDVAGSVRAADRLIRARQVVIPKCGHAPQIEKAGLVNKLVQRFLRDTLKSIPPTLDPARFLDQARKNAQRRRKKNLQDLLMPRPGARPSGRGSHDRHR
jgi:hypothetical protein